uniref:Uncharacterized protein n=1 Tax=Oryza meridionalis TaxID=40149 RepID=A0A0E0EPJ9_9ORYZ
MLPRTSCIGGSIAKVQRRCMAGGVEQEMEREIGDAGWPGHYQKPNRVGSHRYGNWRRRSRSQLKGSGALTGAPKPEPRMNPKKEHGVPLKRTTHLSTTTDVTTRLAM